MNVLLLKCGLPHDTVIVCVRPGQYPLKKDDPTFSSLEAAFLLVEVFYYVPNVTHTARKRSVCARLKRGDPGNEIDGNKSVFSYTNIKNPVKISSCNM